MTSVSVFYIPEQFFTCNLFLQGGENRGFLFHPAYLFHFVSQFPAHICFVLLFTVPDIFFQI